MSCVFTLLRTNTRRLVSTNAFAQLQSRRLISHIAGLASAGATRSLNKHSRRGYLEARDRAWCCARGNGRAQSGAVRAFWPQHQLGTVTPAPVFKQGVDTANYTWQSRRYDAALRIQYYVYLHRQICRPRFTNRAVFAARRFDSGSDAILVPPISSIPHLTVCTPREHTDRYPVNTVFCKFEQ